MPLFKGPVLCNYYVTYRCNAKCSFCDIWEKPSPYIQAEDVRHNLLDLKRLGVKVVDFTGGEPLLHREIDQFLSMARKMGFITTLTTNTLLYPKWADKLKGNVDMLHFSLDHADAQKHNESRGVDCYDHLLESIRIAKGLGERPDILFTVFPDNLDEIAEVYDRFYGNEGLQVILNPVFSYAEVGEELSNEAMVELRKWAGKEGIYLNEAFLDLREAGGNQIAGPVCKAASTTIVISPENELMLPCYHLGMDQFEINGGLYDLWRSDKVQELIKMEGKWEKCQGCTVNCYMEPSFTYELNKWFFRSLKSTLKYSLEKWVYA